MRFTLLHPDPARGPGLQATDVEADVGTALSVLRPALARVSGYAGWTSAAVRPAVADAVLDEHHTVGQPPLVDGCVLRTEPGPRPAVALAVASAWYVAVAAGPDSGGLVAVPTDATVTVGPVGSDLAVQDTTLPVVQVRCRRGRVRSRTGRRGRWHRWHPERPRRLGDTTLVLRGVPGVSPEVTAADPAPAARPATWLTPLVGSVALAAALRQPLLALAGLALPLVALVGAAVTRWRSRHPTAADRSVQDPAALVAATARACTASAEPATLDQPWDAGGSLAIVGPRDLALPVARAAVLGSLGTHLRGTLAVRTRHADAWGWCAWVTAPDAPLPRGSDDALVVVDDPVDLAEIARWRASAPPSHRLLLVVGSAAAVPAWCRSRVEVGPRSVRLHSDDGPVRDVPRHTLTAPRALEQARRAAAARAASRRDEPGTGLPDRASLATLDGIPAADRVAATWAAPRSGLVAALGIGTGGRTLAVDLVADGPHALVAGTTGAGKSELLTTLVLALALTHPPDRLAILLVDFKGGTGLGPVAGLPHVLEHVTDLDAAHARRILAGLRAELRRRESVLAAAGVRDLVDLDPTAPGTPPRLLVVVDELRALTEDVPDAAAALTRIAAQGRALGVHLVLATQRPAGAVGADLRANVALRIALRVTDQADSTDVLDAPDAARIDPTTPGRAWVRRGTRSLEPVQVARAVPAAAAPVVRAALRWSPAGAGWSPTSSATPPPVDDPVGGWVRAAGEASSGRPPGGCPWLPALPSVVRGAEVPDGPGLALGVSDLPDEQRRGSVRWDPSDGPLLVLGGPRSGRSTTLLAAGLDALDQGWEVHAIGLPGEAVDRLRAVDRHGGLGSTLATEDARAVARLLELAVAPGRGRVLLLVDRLDLLIESLGRLARGAGVDRLTVLWRGNPTGTGLAAGADVGAAALQHAGAFARRLVLPQPDTTLDALAGVPVALAGRRATPGRAVWVHPGGAELCQLVLPGHPSDPGRAVAPPHRSAVLVRALPERAVMPAGSGSGTGTGTDAGAGLTVPLGPGGDDGDTVRVDLTEGLLVAGPPGSGRSTVLAVLARSLGRAGVHVVRLVDPSAGPPPELPGVRDIGPADVLEACERVGTSVLMVDDLDELERGHPELLGALPPARLVATVASATAVQAFRGCIPTLLRRRRVLVLDVHDPASAELVGPRAPWCVDPLHRPAGRGVLLRGRDATVVQVYSAAS
ncbi:FtsK/SpoIIIE domain-containing protein [Cellulomonas sp.]|uniref:FtsK/SpoIIIE domain-containing protein n=1 Tax=Cellulomonas sp. TaxID=40001 RepID=UPI003BABE604